MVLYILIEVEIGFYLSALRRGFDYPILNIGLTISIVYLLYCIIHLVWKLLQFKTVVNQILYLQLVQIFGQIALMIIMFFVRM